MRGVINHIAINVSDREVSNLFYTPILEWLGYVVEEELDELTVWVHKGSGTAINIWDTKEEHKKSEFNRHAIGLNHIAFNAKTAKEVDEFIHQLKDIGVIIHKQDERFSSRGAVSTGDDDSSSAAIILQTYLDSLG